MRIVRITAAVLAAVCLSAPVMAQDGYTLSAPLVVTPNTAQGPYEGDMRTPPAYSMAPSVGGGVTVIVSPTVPIGPVPVRPFCNADVERLCGQAFGGGLRQISCLYSNRDQLSPGCRAAF